MTRTGAGRRATIKCMAETAGGRARLSRLSAEVLRVYAPFIAAARREAAAQDT